MMNYSFLPAIGLVHVNFGIPLPHHQELYEMYFAGRDLELNAADEWTDLWCTVEEWEGYLKSGAQGAALMDDPKVVEFMRLELYIFRQWLAALYQTPFYKPQGGLQA